MIDVSISHRKRLVVAHSSSQPGFVEFRTKKQRRNGKWRFTQKGFAVSERQLKELLFELIEALQGA